MISRKPPNSRPKKKGRTQTIGEGQARTINFTQVDKLYDSAKEARYSWDETKQFLDETYRILRIEGVLTDKTTKIVMSKMKRFDNVMTNTIRLLTKLQQYYDF